MESCPFCNHSMSEHEGGKATVTIDTFGCEECVACNLIKNKLTFEKKEK